MCNTKTLYWYIPNVGVLFELVLEGKMEKVYQEEIKKREEQIRRSIDEYEKEKIKAIIEIAKKESRSPEEFQEKIKLYTEFVDECGKDVCSFEKIKELILAGANPNMEIDRIIDKNVITWSFYNNDLMYEYSEELGEDDFIHYTKEQEIIVIEKYREYIKFLVEHGWDINEYAFEAMHSLLFFGEENSPMPAELIMLFLEYDYTNKEKEFESLCKAAAMEESYQRCNDNHADENMYYTLVEAFYAKKIGEDPHSIKTYRYAIGKRINKVVFFKEQDTTEQTERFTIYNADIGLQCEDRMLIIMSCVNILCMDNRANEKPQTILKQLNDRIAGKTIVDISFDHNEIIKYRTHYGQQIIIITLDDGLKVCFTHNYGEKENEETISRFYIIDGNKDVV